jgi:phage head maturation protease
MPDLVELLNTRSTSVSKDGTIHFPDRSEFVSVDKDGNAFAVTADAVQSVDKGLMSARFKISSNAKDRMGDVIVPAGCLTRLETYKANPVVFLNHKSYFGLPIAKSAHPETGEFTVEVAANDIYATAFFHGLTEESTQTFALVAEGYLKAASIGFRPIKARFIDEEKASKDRDLIEFDKLFPGLLFEEWELTEWSVVGIPANPEAVRSLLSKGMFNGARLLEPLRKELESHLPEVTSVSVAVPETISEIVPASEAEPVVVAEIPATLEKNLDPDFSLNTQGQEIISVAGEETKSLDALIGPPQQGLQPPLKTEEEAKPVPADSLMPHSGYCLDLHAPSGPLGMQLLVCCCYELCEIACCLETHLKNLEQPKVKTFLEDFGTKAQKLLDKVWETGEKYYPDMFGTPEQMKQMWENLKTKHAEVIQSVAAPLVPVTISPTLLTQKTEPSPEDELSADDLALMKHLLENLAQSGAKLTESLYELTGKEV